MPLQARCGRRCMIWPMKGGIITYITRMGEAAHKFENASAAQQTALDKEFHYMLIKAAGNHFLEIFMESISDIYQGWVNAVLSDIPNDDMQALKRVTLRHI